MASESHQLCSQMWKVGVILGLTWCCWNIQHVSGGWQSDPYGFSLLANNIRQRKHSTDHKELMGAVVPPIQTDRYRQTYKLTRMLRVLQLLGQGPNVANLHTDHYALFTSKRSFELNK